MFHSETPRVVFIAYVPSVPTAQLGENLVWSRGLVCLFCHCILSLGTVQDTEMVLDIHSSINIKFTTEFKYPAPKKRKMEGGKRK